ncbi:hypothetical protein BDV23DRAFT_184076 [Aspergillus alliaceus]|uniref:DUF7730 domain-containing protein n=1 Tax=Petromyces alliaceus TaxID=209559 RepID=A0A5N7C6S3_PETAA|nr:hypothetical protein BDV23DRAFT_184076 [Aspergillus alliaceus]
MKIKLTTYETKISKTFPKVSKLFRPTPKHERTFFLNLLDLPSEIRLLIYRFAFATPCDRILVTVHRYRRASRPQINSDDPNERPAPELRYTRTPPVSLPVALLQTNRQIYCEALPVLYANIIFATSLNPTLLMHMKDRLSVFARNNIQQVQLSPTPLLSESITQERELLSWTVLCADVADMPGLRQVYISYPEPGILRNGTVKFHRSRYAKWLGQVRAKKTLVFDTSEVSAEEMDECCERLREIIQDTSNTSGD